MPTAPDEDESHSNSHSNSSDYSIPRKDELHQAEEVYMRAFLQQDVPGTPDSSLTVDLLQSAAAVMLDDPHKAPSTTVSDDDDENENTSVKNVDDSQSSSCSDLLDEHRRLECFQTERLPAMPDVQDRKRFVGCLAAVLASLYEYDNLTEDEFSKSDEVLNRAYLDLNEHSDHDYDGAPISSTVEQVQQQQQQEMPARRSFGGSSQLKKATARHRRRRYDTLAHVLVSTGEYLDLDTGQVKAFLPMLARLLVPNPKPAAEDKNQQQRAKASIYPGQRGSKSEEDGEQNAATQEGVSETVDGFANDFVNQEIDRMEHLRPFLESLTPGAGFRCVALMLLQTVLHCNMVGYDARVRHALKTVAVLVLAADGNYAHAMTTSSSSRRRTRDIVEIATRQFESLEQYIAKTLIELSKQKPHTGESSGAASSTSKNSTEENGRRQKMEQRQGLSRRQILRGIKVGGTAVAAGSLFAITGGIAAPAIAGFVATVAGGTAVAATAAVLTSTTALTTIFGVGGGGLAAYKMQRRTKGLTEFEFTREGHQDANNETAELFSTICISGWVRDKHDFQRPWGVTPNTLEDKLEKLERFYVVHSPSHVRKCQKILDHWKNEENDLWKLLRNKYGSDPDTLFPLKKGPRIRAALTLEQREIVDELFVQLGYAVGPGGPRRQPTPLERMRNGWRKKGAKVQTDSQIRHSLADSDDDQKVCAGSDVGRTSVTSIGFESVSTGVSSSQHLELTESKEDPKATKKEFPKHLKTVWDYQARYGGEHYTVKWEASLLNELCSSVNAMAVDLARGGAAQILRHTALASVATAVALPAAMVSAANMIDGTWTLAVERADEAGQELARSLLFSRAGHRPVTLVGYSFGARTIYACMKELARLQEKWEDFHEEEERAPPNFSSKQKHFPTNENYDESDKNFFRHMREPSSILEDVILMGMPNHLSLVSWKSCRQVVAGRLVNCFSQKDLILSLMFQLKRMGLKPVCGTCPVDVPGIENFDVTDLVSGHQDYCLVVGDVLKRVRHCQPLRSRHTGAFLPGPDISINASNIPDKYDV